MSSNCPCALRSAYTFFLPEVLCVVRFFVVAIEPPSKVSRIIRWNLVVSRLHGCGGGNILAYTTARCLVSQLKCNGLIGWSGAGKQADSRVLGMGEGEPRPMAVSVSTGRRRRAFRRCRLCRQTDCN